MAAGPTARDVALSGIAIVDQWLITLERSFNQFTPAYYVEFVRNLRDDQARGLPHIKKAIETGEHDEFIAGFIDGRVKAREDVEAKAKEAAKPTLKE